MALAVGLSCLNQNEASLALAQSTLSAATEAILGGTAGQSNAAIPWNWPQLGASLVRVGVCGVATVTGNPVTVRLRLGGAPTSSSGDVAGTIVKSFVLPVGAGQVFDQLSDPVAVPAAISYLQVTAESAGSAQIDVQRLTAHAVPQTVMQALLVATSQDMDHSGGSEIVRAQWLVDFDRFDTDEILIAIAGRSFQAVGTTARYKVRLGGTAGGLDGDTPISYVRSGDNGGDGTLSGAAATVARPTGITLVKLTVQSLDGFPCKMRGGSILFRGV